MKRPKYYKYENRLINKRFEILRDEFLVDVEKHFKESGKEIIGQSLVIDITNKEAFIRYTYNLGGEFITNVSDDFYKLYDLVVGK